MTRMACRLLPTGRQQPGRESRLRHAERKAQLPA